VIVSVTEGEDKPLKYPTIFNTADVAVLSKIDLAEAVGFDREAALRSVEAVRPGMRTIALSARTGEGMNDYLALLEAALQSSRETAATAP
jgi:hydrogenase nickel incorporation protein HypB